MFQMTKFQSDKVIIFKHVHRYAVDLESLRCSRNFWITKYIGFESFLFPLTFECINNLNQ